MILIILSIVCKIVHIILVQWLLSSLQIPITTKGGIMEWQRTWAMGSWYPTRSSSWWVVSSCDLWLWRVRNLMLLMNHQLSMIWIGGRYSLFPFQIFWIINFMMKTTMILIILISQGHYSSQFEWAYQTRTAHLFDTGCRKSRISATYSLVEGSCPFFMNSSCSKITSRSNLGYCFKTFLRIFW